MVERATKRGESHQFRGTRPPLPIMHISGTGDAGLREFRVGMFPTEHARAEAPFFRLSADADCLEVALKNALRTNQLSMDNLHLAIAHCVRALRSDGMRCEAVILTMKACIRHMARKNAGPTAPGIVYAYPLMDQIVKWSIDEYYHDE